jgi:glutamyl-tRNA synthetase
VPFRKPLRTRFAPSPTGDLHLGGAFCALASWVLARASGGAFVVRVEDLDGPRVVPGSEARILDDLTSLGLAWDEGPRVGGPHGPYAQSARSGLYQAALDQLWAKGLVYPCDCSRADIARVASAPHAGEEVVYPGTCRELDPERSMKRPPALRLRVPAGAVVTIDDASFGPLTQDIGASVGDFVLRRGDGVFAYQLAVVVDDLAMEIDLVVRGVDLLPSTPRQVLLAQLLEAKAAPRTLHLPLIVDTDGQRLSKRTAGAAVRRLLAARVSSEEILGTLAGALGFSQGVTPRPAPALVGEARAHAPRWPHESVRIPEAWARVAGVPG